MPTDELSDSQLVEQFRAGHQDAFERIDHRYRPILLRYLGRFGLGPELAEELTQQTLVCAFERLDQLRSGENLAGWFHRIAFHLVAAEKRRPVRISLDQVEPVPEREERNVEDKQEQQSIWTKAKEHVSDEEYRILLLFYQEDLPLARIAEQLGKKEGAVRVQLHRARKKLQPLCRK